jgi:hypothetical protein
MSILNNCTRKQNMLVAVDGEGKPSRTMNWPENCGRLVFVGQSQGRLHCVSVHAGDHVQIVVTALTLMWSPFSQIVVWSSLWSIGTGG